MLTYCLLIFFSVLLHFYFISFLAVGFSERAWTQASLGAVQKRCGVWMERNESSHIFFTFSTVLLIIALINTSIICLKNWIIFITILKQSTNKIVLLHIFKPPECKLLSYYNLIILLQTWIKIRYLVTFNECFFFVCFCFFFYFLKQNTIRFEWWI